MIVAGLSLILRKVRAWRKCLLRARDADLRARGLRTQRIGFLQLKRLTPRAPTIGEPDRMTTASLGTTFWVTPLNGTQLLQQTDD